ncbi:MAG: NHL repeat-containing protein [Verrucomicrobiota bacterium]
MESMLNEKTGQAGNRNGRLRTLVLSLLLMGVMLLLDFLFAPALIRFLEAVTESFSTVEVVTRAYFLIFFLQLILVLAFFLFVRPVAGLKQRLILYTLLVESFVLCTIWIFDNPDNYFRSEDSALTYFSSIVLTLCAAGASINLLILKIQDNAGKASRIFWTLLAAAFLFAAIDEFFKIHERFAALARLSNFGQDLLTAAYAIGAFCVLVVFYKTFRNDLFRWKNYFIRLLVAGIATLGLAVFLDTFDRVFQYFFGHLFNANHLCNSLEELMEFTAACLFFCACFVAILEADNGRILKQVESRMKTIQPSKAFKAGFAGIVFLAAAGLLGMKLAYGVPDDGIVEENGFHVTLFADMDDGLRGPDGLFFHPDYGLIVCNEHAGELLVFDQDGQSRILVNARSGLSSPEGLAVGAKGIFVSDDSKGRIVRYPAVGADPVVVWSEGLKSPEGLAIDDQDRLYIADEGLSMVVRQVGNHREIIASSLDGLMTPEEMAFDEEGNLYVTDEAACSIFKISPEGEVALFADKTAGLVCPEGIVVHDDMIYVTEDGTGLVFRFEPDGAGEVFLRFGKRFRRVSGIAFDDKGFLYLVACNPLSRQAVIFKVEL